MKSIKNKGLINLALLLCLFSFSSCMKAAYPEFKEVSDVNFSKFGFDEIALDGKAYFHNPNRFRVRIKEMKVNIQVNGNNLTTFSQTDKVVIRRKSDFALPLQISVNPKDSFKNFAGGAILGALTQKMEVGYEGYIIMKALFFIPVKIPISDKVEIKL